MGARARARITLGSILCSSFNYSSQCCERLVPVFRDKGMLHVGSYFSSYCTVPASHCTTLIVRVSSYGCTQIGLVLWQLFTQPRLQNHNTLTSLRSIYYFLIHVLVNRVQIIREKNASTKITSFFAHVFYLIYEGLHNLHALFEVDFRYVL